MTLRWRVSYADGWPEGWGDTPTEALEDLLARLDQRVEWAEGDAARVRRAAERAKREIAEASA